MSRTANDEQTEADAGWLQARNELFRMIMEGRSFSGRERNCCFLNTGMGKFATVSALSGIDFPDDGRCIAVSDWDRDGDLDLWISNRNGPRLRLLKNNTAAAHHFISIGLQGNGTTTNRDAIGARVEVVVHATTTANAAQSPEANDVSTTGTRLVQTLRAGEGFLSQSSKWLHFGLGPATQIERIEIQWPGGERQTVTGYQVDRRYRIEQERPTAIAIDLPSAPTMAEGEAPLPDPTQVARVALISRVPMPAVSFVAADGSRQQESFTAGTPTFVSLWASWCRPCVEELAALSKSNKQLAAAGLRVLALNVDELSDNEVPELGAAGLLAALGYSQAWGRLSLEQMNLLQDLHDEFFFMKRPLPLPSGFLIDAQGRLAVIYRGPVSVEQLLRDCEQPAPDARQARLNAACLPGRIVEHPRAEEVALRDDLQTRYHVALFLESNGQFSAALRSFLELAQLDPNWGLPQGHLAKLYLQQNQLDTAYQHMLRAAELDPVPNATAENTAGLILSRLGKAAEAETRLRKAIELDPDFAEAHNNLGSALATQGKLTAARDCFARAVEIDPKFAEALTNLGSAYVALQQLRPAMDLYERAIAADARALDAYNNLGTLHAQLGNFKEAVKLYEQALQIDPQHPNARANLERARQRLTSPNQP